MVIKLGHLTSAADDRVTKDTLVHRLLNPLGFVAFQNGSSARREEGTYLDPYVTDDQRSSRPIFNSTLRAAAGWPFFRVARSTAMIQRAALYRQSGSDRPEKQPTGLRRSPRDLGDDALAIERLVQVWGTGNPYSGVPRANQESLPLNP